MIKLLIVIIINFFVFHLTACVSNKNDYKNNIEFVNANKGDIDSKYNVAMNYLMGDDGYPLNEAQALIWFKKAAEQGDAGAQNSLGIMYLRGMGVDKDIGKAKYYYSLAANQKHENAMYQYAILMLDSKDDKEKLKAKALLEELSKSGHKEAIQLLKSVN